MYANVKNDTIIEYPLTEFEIKNRFQNVSWVNGEFYPPEGYVVVNETEAPFYNYTTQTIIESEPELREDGYWYQTWIVSELSDEKKQKHINDRWAVIRVERNNKLQESDWTRLDDVSIDKEQWRLYRQALRDITEQADPFNIVWPIPPE